MTLTTARLRLRPWRDTDLEPFSEMNGDPRVMEHFPKLLTREESDSSVTRMKSHFEKYGYGFWALELIDEAPFVGFTGLLQTPFEAHFTPCVEVGWRLAFPYWGRGFATEAARASLEFGFNKLNLREIVAFTVPANRRSRSVMEKIGMRRSEADDFNHPRVEMNHPLSRHVLYRIRKGEYVKK